MKTVYTAIFGKYDDLKEPLIKNHRWKYVCFTDQNLVSDTWEIRKVPVMDCGPAKTARYYKIMFHKHVETEFSMWIDATFIINVDLTKWWKRFEAPFTVINHPFDKCIYKDADSCLKLGRGDKNKILRQVDYYHAVGIPKNNSLISSGILMRQNETSVKEFCTTWWKQVQNWSERDQIAYGFANHQHPTVISKRIDWNYQAQKEFIHIPHLGKPHRTELLKRVNIRYGKAKGI